MRISVISYALNQLTKAGTMNVFGYLESCRYRYDLRAADIWNGTLESLDNDYLAKVKDGLDERGLALACLAVDGAHIWEDDPDQRAAHHRNALAHLAAAEVLGAKTVRIDAGGGRQDLAWTAEQFDEIVTRYREYAQRAADQGYHLGPENHWGPEVVPANVKKLCEAVDSPAFGVLLHAGRWRGDGADQGDAMVAPWVMHTHLGPTLSDSELAETMQMLRDGGYGGYYGAEMNTTRYSEVAVQLARIRDVGERWRSEA